LAKFVGAAHLGDQLPIGLGLAAIKPQRTAPVLRQREHAPVTQGGEGRF